MPTGAQDFVSSREQQRSASEHGETLGGLRRSPRPQVFQKSGNHQDWVIEKKNRQKLADDMRLPLPAANCKWDENKPTEGCQPTLGLASGNKSPQAVKFSRHTCLDNTESIQSTTNSECSYPQDSDVEGSDQNRETDAPARFPAHAWSRARFAKLQQHVPQGAPAAFATVLSPKMKAEIIEGRKIYQNWEAAQNRHDQKSGENEEEFYSDEEEEAKGSNNSDGRALVGQNAAAAIPERPGRPSTTNMMAPPKFPAANQIQVRHLEPPPKTTISSQSAHSRPGFAATTKSSSLVSSEDEGLARPLQGHNDPPPSKRPYSDDLLDFDINALRSMKYSDLENDPFTHDPRAVPPKPVHDENGVPLALPGKLSNMSRMREGDIKVMFESLTDEERELTGSWFLGELNVMMEQLTDLRVQRRKISMDFEADIKRRLAAVEKKENELDEELRGLKKGGTQLIGRKTAGISVTADLGTSKDDKRK